MLRRALLLTALIAVAGCPSGAWGRSLVDIDIVDRDTGQWLPETPFRGDTWVAGTPGHRYSVRLTNTTGERVLVVLSVDGVNAVTGQTANPAQTGYVLAPWQSAEISGWRKSMDDVAQFVFTDLPDSYAARTGRPRNVGVVGIAVFREKRPIAYYEPTPVPAPYPMEQGAMDREAAKAAAPAAQGSMHVARAATAAQRRALQARVAEIEQPALRHAPRIRTLTSPEWSTRSAPPSRRTRNAPSGASPSATAVAVPSCRWTSIARPANASSAA